MGGAKKAVDAGLAEAGGGKRVRTPAARKTSTIRLPDGSRAPRPKSFQAVHNIRRLDVDDAVSLARQEPHLIPSGSASEGGFVGGPRNVKNRRALTAMRDRFDDVTEAGAPGGDWYDRYRSNVEEVTGGDLRDDLWMSNLEGQYSAGVSPEGELGFALKDTNSAIAYGTPVKAARPAQQAASARAIAENDPGLIQLGEKTGEYARRINPAVTHERSATGVNDFRHFRNLGYTDASGRPVDQVKGVPSHRFADYETALAVDRANQNRFGGRSDWTGEQVQAAAWVKQKADDFFKRNRKSYMKRAKALTKPDDGRSVEDVAWQIAFDDANRTIGDFYNKHTAFATHEAQPYAGAGHLSGLRGAADRMRYASDPRSTWATAPGGRDAIYSEMRLGDTGYAVRTRPTTSMQGVYTPPGGDMEYNPGSVARPLVAFENSKGGTKSVPEADRAILDAGEATRAYIDVQGAGAWHKPWAGGRAKDSLSLYAEGLPGPVSQSTLEQAAAAGERYGLGDVIDTGTGLTLTNFGDLPSMSQKEYKALANRLGELGFSDSYRVKVDSGYRGFEGDWEAGGGAATNRLLSYLDEAPEGVVRALDNNPLIPKAALDRMSRDEDFASTFGAARSDVQTARKIIGEGPGWVGRLRAAVKSGQVLPAIAGLLLAPAVLQTGERDE